MICAKLNQEGNRKDSLYRRGVEVFAGALPGCTVDCKGLLDYCPHCRNENVEFKRFGRRETPEKGVRDGMRSYVESPRTIELLASRHIHQMATATVDLALEKALVSLAQNVFHCPETENT